MSSLKGGSALSAAFFVPIVLLTAAILLRFGYNLDLGPGQNSIRALIWEYVDAPWFSGIRFVRPGQVFEAVLYTFPKYVFIFQVFTLYRIGSNRRRLVAVGILGALFPALVSLVLIIGWLQGWTQPPPPVSDHYFPIYIPIPTILILSTILLRLFPVENLDDTEPS
jgi:hypothetical protein